MIRPPRLFALLLTCAPALAGAQVVDSVHPLVERAVITADWPALDSSIARLRTAAMHAPRDAAVHYELGYALHRRASALLLENDRRAARPLLEEADQALELGYGLDAAPATLALRGAVIGQLARVSGTLKAVRYRRRAFGLLDQALKRAPNDPRIALLNGMTRLNAPRAFGGGRGRAERELRRAVGLFAADSARVGPGAWGRADAHIWLGITLDRADRRDEARAEFRRALDLIPGHALVTRNLLPKLEERERKEEEKKERKGERATAATRNEKRP